ncbi:hypothetical protein LLG96_20105 [bacterium]|nr:hypothetical protein [bacterium]
MKYAHIRTMTAAFFAGLYVAVTSAAAAVSVPVTVTEPSGVARPNEGIHSGIPIKKGEVKSTGELILVDEAGKPVPAQFETLSRWDDGSVRWVLLIVKESIGAGQTKSYTLRTLKKNELAPEHSDRVSISDENDIFAVDTGKVRFRIPIYSGSILSNIERRDDSGKWVVVSSKGLEAVIWRTGIKKFKSRIENCTVESAGPLRAVIRIEGHHLLWDHTTDSYDPSELATFKFVVRVFCYAGSDEIRLQYTFINDNRDNRIRPSERYHVYAMEELADYKWVNGHWDERPQGIKFREEELLEDDYGQVNVRDIRLRLSLDDEYTGYRFGVAGGSPVTGAIDGPVALEQVGPVYSYDDYFKDMPYPHIPFKAMVIHGKGQPSNEFDRAEGSVIMTGKQSSLFFGSKFFWQYHPKIYALDKNALEFHVWNKLEDIPDPEIGFAKTHEITIRFGGPSASYDTGALMAGLNRPLMAVTTPAQYMSSGVFGTYLPANVALWKDTEEYLLASNGNSEKTRAGQNIYGVRNYGDQPGIRYVPIYYNHEYDTLLGATLQFARTGNRSYFDESDILAWHFMDVDVLHASNNPLNEKGQHMHFTDHAKGETHAGHGTVEGLWYYYMLTGEPRAKDVAVGIADFFAKIAAWKDFLDFRDDEERTIGWALKALVPSYRATLNPRYKLAAQMIVEQAIAGQNPDTGNWDHPLYPNEDKHRPVCVGGKPWMVGIILQGMKHYDREFNDPRVKQLILKAADWMIWSNYVYMTCSDMKPGETASATHFDGLTYAWEISGKRYYLDEALKGFNRSVESWKKDRAASSTVSGNSLEGVANVMRIIEEQGTKVWKDGQPVLDPKSDDTVKAMRANPKFKAKPQKRY